MRTHSLLSRAGVLLLWGAVSVLFALSSTTVAASDTVYVSWQARITDADGNPLPEGYYSMEFRFYADSVGGAPLWVDAKPEGVYIGAHEVGHSFLSFVDEYVESGFEGMNGLWMEVVIEGEVLSPRSRIGSVPHTAVARRVSGDLKTGPGLLQLYPPDPCVPLEPCGPAFELIADAEVHTMRLYKPGDQVPGFEVEIFNDATPNGARVGMTAGNDTDSTGWLATVNLSEGSSENKWWWTSTVSGKMWSFDLTTPTTYKMVAGAMSPLGDSSTIALEANSSLANITLFQGNSTDNTDIVLRATADGGGQIGINTDTPAGALDVNGTTKTAGFKMPTDAADGYVLTSDGEGNGTWQDPASTDGMVGHAANVNDATDGSGNVTVTYPAGLFSSTPSLSVTAQFNSGGIAQMGWVTVSGHTASGFTLNVKDGNGSNWVSGAVQISYTAIGQ